LSPYAAVVAAIASPVGSEIVFVVPSAAVARRVAVPTESAV
jgi:hypothetical protein